VTLRSRPLGWCSSRMIHFSFSSSPHPSSPTGSSMKQARVIIVAIPRETGVLLSSVPPPKGKREEGGGGGRGNDFEIFVAVHKSEGGWYAYLNTESLLPCVRLSSSRSSSSCSPSSSPPPPSTARAAALLDLTSSLSSFLVSLLRRPLLLFGSRPPLSHER